MFSLTVSAIAKKSSYRFRIALNSNNCACHTDHHIAIRPAVSPGSVQSSGAVSNDYFKMPNGNFLCKNNSDALCFCRGYTYPLARMGVALDRCIPGRNSMLVNEVYVKTPRATKQLLLEVKPLYRQICSQHLLVIIFIK